jgi:hypothetical protein
VEMELPRFFMKMILFSIFQFTNTIKVSSTLQTTKPRLSFSVKAKVTALIGFSALMTPQMI